jgi:hypothetical protein
MFVLNGVSHPRSTSRSYLLRSTLPAVYFRPPPATIRRSSLMSSSCTIVTFLESPRPGRVLSQPRGESNRKRAEAPPGGDESVLDDWVFWTRRARRALRSTGGPQQCLSLQVAQHDLAGFFGLSQRFEGRAADLDGALFLMMDRTPGRHEAGSSAKAGTAAALIADHERKAVAAPAPYFHVRDGTNDAGELHGHSHRRPTSSVGSADDQTLSQRWFQARQRGYPRAPAPTQKQAVDSLAALPPHQTPEPQRTHRRASYGLEARRPYFAPGRSACPPLGHPRSDRRHSAEFDNLLFAVSYGK